MRLPPFQNLLDAHARGVHRFLIATVGPVEADDVYQETWLAALRAYPELTEASNLQGWLFTIAHRKAIDHVRARARRATPVSEPADLPEAPATEAVAAVADEGLWAAVAALPDKQRTAVALRFIADSAYAEIATAMEISEPAARRNVHEGLKRLREERTR
ncbi:MAG TPA: sigma-70 family RNA polymerase sigma factor [Solirubrobacteraceae bacterium]|nr:sigma-70 family RNA polymerase sigma factor [Solirubrobacteraceae bacterium]